MGTTEEFINDIKARRGIIRPGYNPNRFVKLVGGVEVPKLWRRPDAKTSRTGYYYNTRQNKLYKRIKAVNPTTKKTVYFWQLVSEC